MQGGFGADRRGAGSALRTVALGDALAAADGPMALRPLTDGVTPSDTDWLA
mgnify:CR=1 FL=1